MARRLVLMPVLPSVTVSVAENLVGSLVSARAARMFLEESCFAVSQVAPRAVVERMRNSRRCIEYSCLRGALAMRLHPKLIAEIAENDRRGRGENSLFELFAEGGELLVDFG